MVVLVVDPETAIIDVLDRAWGKFANGEVGAYLGEKDYEFEEFVINELERLGADAVVWYTGTPNCRFVVKWGDQYFDVDYVSYDITEIDCEDAVERASWGLSDRELAEEMMGPCENEEDLVAKFEVFETDDPEGTGQATNVTKIFNATYIGPDAEEVYGKVVDMLYDHFFGKYDITDSSHEYEESVFVDMPYLSIHAEVKPIEYSDDLSNRLSKDEFLKVVKRWLDKISKRW